MRREGTVIVPKNRCSVGPAKCKDSNRGSIEIADIALDVDASAVYMEQKYT